MILKLIHLSHYVLHSTLDVKNPCLNPIPVVPKSLSYEKSLSFINQQPTIINQQSSSPEENMPPWSTALFHLCFQVMTHLFKFFQRGREQPFFGTDRMI